MRSIACDWQGCEAEIVAGMIAKSKRVRDLLSAAEARPPVKRIGRWRLGAAEPASSFISAPTTVLGSIPFSADDLRQLFPWQRRSKVPTIAAGGEDLPFNDAEVDIVLSDNVIDHAADPRQILAEIAAC